MQQALTKTLKEFDEELVDRIVQELPAGAAAPRPSPEERLRGLQPEERLRGLQPEERLRGLLPGTWGGPAGRAAAGAFAGRGCGCPERGRRRTTSQIAGPRALKTAASPTAAMFT